MSLDARLEEKDYSEKFERQPLESGCWHFTRTANP